jgi:hypothetical protein
MENKGEKATKNSDFQKFEIEFVKREKVNIIKNFQIMDALYKEAVALGVIPLKNPLDGIEVDLKIARVVNSV